MAIKEVLREELENSLKMREHYEQALAGLPRGSLVKKKIKGHEYYYVVYRDKGKVKFEYLGREINPPVIEQYAEAKKLRAQYRKHLSKIKKQIRFLESVLRSNELV